MSRLVLAAAGVLALGLVVGAVAFVVTGSAPYAIAAYAAGVSTFGLVNGLATSIRDRAHLWFAVELTTHGTNPANVILQLTLVNRGRRTIRYERAGFWHDRGRSFATALPYWQDWARRGAEVDPVLNESDKLTLWIWPQQVATFYQRYPPSRYVFVDDSMGRRHWVTLSPAVAKCLREAWDERPALEARQAAEKEAREQWMADPANHDEYGHPRAFPGLEAVTRRGAAAHDAPAGG